LICRPGTTNTASPAPGSSPGDPEAPGSPLAALPPLPVGALAVGLAELLQAAADLPQPHYVSASSAQMISLLFPAGQSSFAALTRWAQRFGGVLTSGPCEDGRIFCRTEFGYFGVTVEASAFIPAESAA
jgi:hypothetical protein